MPENINPGDPYRITYQQLAQMNQMATAADVAAGLNQGLNQLILEAPHLRGQPMVREVLYSEAFQHPELLGIRCYVRYRRASEAGGARWYNERSSSDWVYERGNAQEFSVAYALGMDLHRSVSYPTTSLYLELLEEPNPLEKGKKCRAEWYLPKSLLDLFKLAPKNDMVRAQVLARVLVPVPDEVSNVDELVGWVEANIDPAKTPIGRAQFNQVRTTVRPPDGGQDDPVRGQDDPVLELHATASDREYGHCNYAVARRARGGIEYSANDIRNALEESNNIEQFWERLRVQARDHVRDHWELEDYGDYEHDDYEASGSENLNVDLRLNDAERASVIAWLRANHPGEVVRLTTPTETPETPEEAPNLDRWIQQNDNEE